MGGSMKGGGGAPQQQNTQSYGGKGGGGMPQGQAMPPPGMPPPTGGMPQGQRPDPQMLQQLQAYAQQRGMGGMPPSPGPMEGMRPPNMGGDYAAQQARMQQMMAMGRGMEGGINGLQKPPPPTGAPMFLGDQGTATPNTMPPPPAAATGASPGGPLSGRNFNPGFGGQRGFGMGRFGGYRGQGGGRFGGMGQINPTPAGADTGLASLPQGYAAGGTVAVAPAAAAPRVSWSPVAQGNSMFTNMGKLPAITKPAAYVAPATNTAIWQPPAVAAKAAPKTNYNMMNMQGGGYWARDPNILANGVRFGGSGSHGGGRG